MFLASAGRAYCRKTPEEEFIRYLHSTGVMPSFRSALVWLYQLPVKPKDLNGYFAEFLENRAKDATEMSKLRAEMCYKTTELAELKKRNQALDEQLRELEGRRSKYKEEDYSEDRPEEEQEERQYEIMQRFFQDLQEYHPSLLSRPAIIFREDEELFGGETEGTNRKSSKAKIEEMDPYQEFVDDMKKFDPWGMVFPYIRDENNKIAARKSKAFKTELADGQENEDSLAKKNRHLEEEDEEMPKFIKSNDDDSRSIVELLQSIYIDSIEKTSDGTELSPHLEEPITWDTEYWKQFFKDGDILPDFGLSILDPKASMFGKVLNANTDLEVQYFNTSRFTSEDTTISVADMKTLLEMRAKSLRNSAEPTEISDTPATRNYRLDNVWTAPKFAEGPLPFKSMYPRPSRKASARKSRSRIVIAPAIDTSQLDDVIKTDVSYGDPALSCAKPLTAYASSSKTSQKSSTAPSRRYSATSRSRPCSKERDYGALGGTSKSAVSLKSPRVASKLPSNVVINRPKPPSRKYSQGTENICEIKPKRKSSKNPLAAMTEGKAGGDCLENVGRMVPNKYKDNSKADDEEKEKTCPPRNRKSVLLKTNPVAPGTDEDQLPDEILPGGPERTDGQRKSSQVKKPRESAFHFQKSPRKSLPSDDDSTNVSHNCEYKMIQSSLRELERRSALASKSTSRSPRKSVASAESRKRVTLNSNKGRRYDPCNPQDVTLMHPYPELLAERKLPAEELKRGEKRFHQLCRQHYGCDYIKQIQRQFDISLFDDM